MLQQRHSLVDAGYVLKVVYRLGKFNYAVLMPKVVLVIREVTFQKRAALLVPILCTGLSSKTFASTQASPR